MMNRTIYATILVLCTWVITGLTGFSQTAFPPINGTHIIDGANILSSETRSSIDHIIQQHEDTSGNQVMVLTIKSLEGNEISMYANEAYNHYTLGQKNNNNGVLLVVAHEDRKVRIEVGYGLEGALPDALCGRIIDNEILPNFKAGDFDAGVSDGVYAILQAIQGTYIAVDTSMEMDWWWPFVFIFASIALIIVIGAIKSGGGGGGFSGGHRGGYYGGGWSSGSSGGGWSGGGGGGWSGGGGGFSGGGGASGSW